MSFEMLCSDGLTQGATVVSWIPSVSKYCTIRYGSAAKVLVNRSLKVLKSLTP